MGNCCSSSKRTNGYDPTIDDKILETETSTSLENINNNNNNNSTHHGGGGHHHHHFIHHHSKKHSNGGNGGNEMKTLNHQNSNNHHISENKRNSLKSSSTHKLLIDEPDDLISASIHQKDPYDLSTLTNHSSSGSSGSVPTTSSISSSNTNHSSIDNSFNSNIESPVVATSHAYSKSTGAFTHTHKRQISTEKAGPQFKTPITSVPHHMRMEGFQRAKHNSTSSLYIKSTLSTPDNDEILRCMANALLYHIERGDKLPIKTVEIFSEEKYPITKGKLDLKTNPTVDTIYKFIRDIFKAEKLDAECAIMCLAYIERIITYTGITLSAVNWRRIVLSTLILASKVFEDQSVWNVDFLPVFDNLTAADLNQLERQLLAMIQYNVSLNASIYAKYYFELRNFSKLDSNQFPLKPLDKSGVRRLEEFTKASEYRVKPFKRSASVDQINPPEIHTRAVIN